MTQPGSLANIVPEGDAWLGRKLRDLQRQIDELRGARRLEAASIGAGGIRVKDGGSITVEGGGLNVTQDGTLTVVAGNGTAILVAGPASDDSAGPGWQSVVLLTRDDGTTALALGDFGSIPGHPHAQALQWLDRQRNVTFADDTVSGQGIARPWMVIGQWDDFGPPPASTTTSSTFTTLSGCAGYRQQPKLGVSYLVQTGTGTTGEVRLVCNGTVLATQTVAAATFQYRSFPVVALPAGSFGDSISLTLDARRTAGTGTIGVRGTGAFGMQS